MTNQELRDSLKQLWCFSSLPKEQLLGIRRSFDDSLSRVGVIQKTLRNLEKDLREVNVCCYLIRLFNYLPI
ncbi:MAG: hypothetical protein R3E01_21570 [Pirellulaceae bacterium]